MATPKPTIQNWLRNLWFKVLSAIGGGYFTKHPAGDPERERDLIVEKFLAQLKPDEVITVNVESLYRSPNNFMDFNGGFNPN